MSLLAPPGAIVRVWFPETETVMQPGPKFRPCLVLEVDDSSKVPRVPFVRSRNAAPAGRTFPRSRHGRSPTTW